MRRPLGVAVLIAAGYLVRRSRRAAGGRGLESRSAVDELLAFDSKEESRAREAFGLASRAVREAIDHHMSMNRHRPEFHADPNDMTEIDFGRLA